MFFVERYRRFALDIGLLVCLVIAGACYSLWRGVDRNFDLLNYHLYAGFALVDWRYDIDLFPASFHTLFNPLIDAPYFLVQRHMGLYWATAFQGLSIGALIFVIWQINRMIMLPDGAERRERVWLCAVSAFSATLIGVTGAAVLGQAGTTMNEVQTAVPVLLAVWIMLRWIDGEPSRLGPCWAAGALLGSAAALKLTAALYAPGVVIALVLVSEKRRCLKPVVVVCAGWILAFAALYGWWGHFLSVTFGSPTFPLFNGIFRSDWIPPSTFSDDRFKPTGLVDYLVYPYYWAFEASYRTSELSVRDPRLLILLLCIIIIFAVRFFVKVDKKIIYVAAFAIVSYSVWLKLFSIYRYTVPLEALSGTVIVAVISLMVALLFRYRALLTAIGSAAVATLLAAFTISPDWGHVPLHASYEIEMRPVPDGSLIAIVGAPAGYLAALVPGRDLEFVGVGPWSASLAGSRLHAVLRARLKDKAASRFAIVREDSDYEALLGSFGLGLVTSQCAPVRTSIDPMAAMVSCPLADLSEDQAIGASPG